MSKKSFFFYLEQKIETESDALAGSAIKQAIKGEIPDFDLSHELVMEGVGAEPDQQISDQQLVELTPGHGHGPRRFFSRPPTNFGA